MPVVAYLFPQICVDLCELLSSKHSKQIPICFECFELQSGAFKSDVTRLSERNGRYWLVYLSTAAYTDYLLGADTLGACKNEKNRNPLK